MGLEMQMDAVTAERDAGAVPNDRIADVVYKDLIVNPLQVIERLYASWDLPITNDFAAALDSYLAASGTTTAARGTTTRSPTPGSTLTTHRALVAPYQGRFAVPSEV